ncbi:hypothetical protein RUMCAL_02860 [Ruminococcus callidus ATCC 27760]|uniref:Uncharacterized protein n=1 Tax=Ruminococcus callidus ATCC 27760 TaxID=411473 RepID=U2LSN5_9FIRM|nr:hypothetical protein RUMCAL_02860 [Ruminococcus callidus ATCC 27760]
MQSSDNKKRTILSLFYCRQAGVMKQTTTRTPILPVFAFCA